MDGLYEPVNDPVEAAKALIVAKKMSRSQLEEMLWTPVANWAETAKGLLGVLEDVTALIAAARECLNVLILARTDKF